jgi:mevalonate kinase
VNESGRGSAPGKVILLGEHSVVFGEPAIAAAIDRRLEVRAQLVPNASPHADARVEAAVAFAARDFEIDRSRLAIEIVSEIPPACGLGSSAALSLALVRALAALAAARLSDEEARRRASRVEDVFHGTASGVDVAASASAGVIWFERANPPRVERLVIRRPVDLVVALSGVPRSTSGPVGRLRERHGRRPDFYARLFGIAGEVVRAGRTAVEREDWGGLGELMDVAQGLLNAFGVSTPTLERMISIARDAGALGAKLSGAGGGGAIIALAPERAQGVAERLRAEGFEAFPTRVGSPDRLEGEDAKPNRASG